MAKTKRRRPSKKGIKAGALKIGKIVYPIAREATSPVSFLDQISAKDRQVMGASFDNAGIMQKVKIMTNIVTGRTTGVNLFKDEYQAPQTINPAGMINKWTKGGLMMLGYEIGSKQVNKMLGKNVLPHGSKIGQIGKRALTGGALGGFFDDEVDTPMQSHVQGGTRGLEAGLRQTQTMQRPILQNVSNSYNGTEESGFA